MAQYHRVPFSLLKRNPVGPVVVVADDDPAMRRFLSHVLRDGGYEVRTAKDVLEAVGQLRQPGVTAAVLDMLFVNSDGRSGLDLLRYIRHHHDLKTLPVIVLTGFQLNRTVVAEVEALHAELWHKPIDPGHFVQRLNRLVDEHGVTP